MKDSVIGKKEWHFVESVITLKVFSVLSEEVVSVGGRRGSKYVFLSPMDPKYLRPLLKTMIIAKAKDITDTQKLIQLIALALCTSYLLARVSFRSHVDGEL